VKRAASEKQYQHHFLLKDPVKANVEPLILWPGHLPPTYKSVFRCRSEYWLLHLLWMDPPFLKEPIARDPTPIQVIFLKYPIIGCQ